MATEHLITYPIGTVIEDGKFGIIKVVETLSPTCKGCVFDCEGKKCLDFLRKYACTPNLRSDRKQVIYKPIK